MTPALIEKMASFHAPGTSRWFNSCPDPEGHRRACAIHRPLSGVDQDVPYSLTVKVPLVARVPAIGRDDDEPYPLVGLSPADVNHIGQTIVALVRAALRHLPPRPAAATAAYSLLAPLRSVRPRAFPRALGHYDAFMETTGRTIRRVGAQCTAHPRKDGRKGCDENTVTRDVKLIYEAVHRKRFNPKEIVRQAAALRQPLPGDELAAWHRFARQQEPDWKGKLRGEIGGDALAGIGFDEEGNLIIQPRKRPRRRRKR
jgi:hypothetical protein